MVFSKPVEYALRAMVFLAMQPPGKLTGAREIARAENIPTPYLWKILQQLARQRLVRSHKGAKGGYELALPANEVRVSDVVFSTGGVDLTGDCVLGLPHCGDENPCPLHKTWKNIRHQLLAMLEQNTLADLAEAAGQRGRKATKKKK